jgi:hypothetical protein
MTTTTLLPVKEQPHVDAWYVEVDGADWDESTEELALGAHNALAAEPLTVDEIRRIENQAQRNDIDVDEQREAAFEVLRETTEAKLPFDPDVAEACVEPFDERLTLRTRPKSTS